MRLLYYEFEESSSSPRHLAQTITIVRKAPRVEASCFFFTAVNEVSTDMAFHVA